MHSLKMQQPPPMIACPTCGHIEASIACHICKTLKVPVAFTEWRKAIIRAHA